MNEKEEIKKTMEKIKSFIYLDNYKMYSISSQIFEGLTEHIVESHKNKDSQRTDIKAGLLDGRIMADIIESNSSRTEKKFLHDYSYTLFEEALIKSEKVLIINEQNIHIEISKVHDFDFIKVTNSVIFNDTKLIEDLLAKFNDMGLAFAYVTNKSSIDQMKELKMFTNKIKDKNHQHKANQMTSQFNLVELAKASGLHMDEEFLKHLKYLLNYGYNGQFEIQVPFAQNESDHLFSCTLNREMLLENETNIVKKYSRETEKEFTVFGILTQTKDISDKKSPYSSKLDNAVAENNLNMKEAVMNLIRHISNVESTFVGKLDYEYIIYPIAVYREI